MLEDFGVYFGREWPHDKFVTFGRVHFYLLGLICFLILLIIVFASAIRKRPFLKAFVKYAIAGMLVCSEASFHLFYALTGRWSYREHLPLQMCSVTSLLGVPLVLYESFGVFEFQYFLGIGGAGQALATPSFGHYDVPHIRGIQFFGTHGGIVLSVAYAAAVLQMKPTFWSVVRVFSWSNVYLWTIWVLNWAIKSNYMFTMAKPAGKSLYDVMGPWPWYMIPVELVAALMFVLLYLPWLLCSCCPKKQEKSAEEDKDKDKDK